MADDKSRARRVASRLTFMVNNLIVADRPLTLVWVERTVSDFVNS